MVIISVLWKNDGKVWIISRQRWTFKHHGRGAVHESRTSRIDPKFDLTYKHEDIQRFTPDSENGAVVGVIPGEENTIRLITFEHTKFFISLDLYVY